MDETINILDSGYNQETFLKKYLPNGFLYKNTLFGNIMPPQVVAAASRFEFRPTDVMVTTYPKAGTHWVSEIVSRLVNPEESKAAKLLDRVPYLDSFKYFNPEDPNPMENLTSDISVAEDLANVPTTQRRIFKCHLSPTFYSSNLTDAKPKIIYCCRNPLDTAVSLYNFYKMVPIFGPFKGTWDEFFEMFKKGYVIYGDYFKHTAEWLSFKDALNVLVVQYEDIQENPHREVRRIAEYIGLNVNITDELIDQVVQDCSFSKMSSNPLILSYLCRKGIVGDWKNYFDDEQKNWIVRKYNELILPLGLKMKY